MAEIQPWPLIEHPLGTDLPLIPHANLNINPPVTVAKLYTALQQIATDYNHLLDMLAAWGLIRTDQS